VKWHFSVLIDVIYGCCRLYFNCLWVFCLI